MNNDLAKSEKTNGKIKRIAETVLYNPWHLDLAVYKWKLGKVCSFGGAGFVFVVLTTKFSFKVNYRRYGRSMGLHGNKINLMKF